MRPSDESGTMVQPKPSKAMILSSAIEYIREIEKERDALREENERLKLGQLGSGTTKNLEGRNDSLDEFMMDPQV